MGSANCRGAQKQQQSVIRDSRGTAAAPWRLYGCWTASSVRDDGRAVECTTTARLTQMTEEEFPHTASFVASAKVVARVGSTVGFGVVGSETIAGCKDHLPGEREVAASLGCHVRDGEVVLVSDGHAFFRGACDTRDPTTITLELRGGVAAFAVDGAAVESSELAAVRLSGTLRLGVGLTKVGQVVELLSDTGVPADAVSSPPRRSGGGDGDALETLTALAGLLAGAAGDGGGGGGGGRGFADNMRSIDCNGADEVAACVQTYIATLHMKAVVSASDAAFEVRVVRAVSKPLIVGLLDEDTAHHAQAPIGSRELRNSVGLMNNGDVVVDGGVRCTFRPFGDGDVVRVELRGGAVRVAVGGSEMAVPGLQVCGGRRFGVTLTERGQAVKLGPEALTPGERQFLLSRSVECE